VSLEDHIHVMEKAKDCLFLWLYCKQTHHCPNRMQMNTTTNDVSPLQFDLAQVLLLPFDLVGVLLLRLDLAEVSPLRLDLAEALSLRFNLEGAESCPGRAVTRRWRWQCQDELTC
jgi:hypothetical protein